MVGDPKNGRRAYVASVVACLVVAILGLMVVACGNSLDQSQSNSLQHAQQRAPYVTQNDVEFNNYNRRQQLADDPTTILWCTSAFPVPGSPLFTVPVVGKLTSGGKRPYAAAASGDTIGPDGMYGSSGDYRYGFTPEGVYVDLTNIATFCSTQPSVWQKESTTLVLATDDALSAAQAKATEQLKAGDKAGAQKTLEDAIKAAGGK